MLNQPEITYVADPMCPWSWAFSPVLRSLRKQFGKRAVFRLILGGLEPFERFIMTDDRRVKMEQQWQRARDISGQIFRTELPNRRQLIFNTEAACRAVVLFRRLGKGKEWLFLEILQKAFFEEGKDISKPEALCQLARDFGLDSDKFRELFNDPELQKENMADFSETRDLGVKEFPTLLMEENYALEVISGGYCGLHDLAPMLDTRLESFESHNNSS